ncbi:MAG: methylmalonyl-CoA mutase family protein, partial [Rhodospirillales bacterium]
DEAFAIPTEEAMKLALRTQQVIADETNVTSVIDPLGGSYFVEALTNEFEKGIVEILDKVDAMGGTIKAIEQGWFQKEIADSAYDFALRKASGERPVIGVNKYVEDGDDPEVEVHAHDPETEASQIAALNRVREERDNQKLAELLDGLKVVAADEDENIMPITIELVKAGASMGDIVETLKGVWGTYRETPVI